MTIMGSTLFMVSFYASWKGIDTKASDSILAGHGHGKGRPARCECAIRRAVYAARLARVVTAPSGLAQAPRSCYTGPEVRVQ
jgi:hypothetical protein